ncbi:porin [Burkholderia plantarii]|uniref:porin n=1 Tax=Burkholderia plantarii TaxID=41899 RepID=UPI0006D89401|nr:porin [Burkholderia plantarii]ALK32974.1 Outer membrane protein porin [Burkholderia plantarii]GLZ20411.1 porin [Burkholderia plantarii]
MKKHFAAASLLLPLATAAWAQSSVTLYGIVDAGLTYRSNERTGTGPGAAGHSTLALAGGALSGSRWGIRGTETLGGGWRAIFALENGFEIASGTSQQGNRLFGRQAFVGLGNERYGTLTMGRQYTSLDDFVNGVSPVKFSGGYAAHPGDIDDLDQTVRVDNAVKYTSANYDGLTFGAMYGFGNQAGSMKRRSTWSVGAAYANGPLKLGAGFERADNGRAGQLAPGGGRWDGSDDGTFGSSISEGFASAQTQQILATGATWDFGPVLVGANYSNVQYRAGGNSLYHGHATFNIAGLFTQWKVAANTRLFAGYNYTRRGDVDGLAESATYHDASLGAFYDLSKRTTVYLLGAYQHASGMTLDAFGRPTAATASASDKANGHSAATRSQTLVSVGLRQLF